MSFNLESEDTEKFRAENNSNGIHPPTGLNVRIADIITDLADYDPTNIFGEDVMDESKYTYNSPPFLKPALTVVGDIYSRFGPNYKGNKQRIRPTGDPRFGRPITNNLHLWQNYIPRDGSVELTYDYLFDLMMQHVDPLIRDTFNKYFKLGYIPHYFEIVNPHNILIKAQSETLTPAKFEHAALTNLNQYKEFLDRISTNLHFNIKHLKRCSLAGENRRINLRKYGWSYEKLIAQIKRFSVEIPNLWAPKRTRLGIYRGQIVQSEMLTIPQRIKLQNIINYIIPSAYNRLSDESKIIFQKWQNGEDIPKDSTMKLFFDYIGFETHVRLSENADKKVFRYYYLNELKARSLQGLGKSPTKPKEYYETLYRHLYHTVQFLDWNTICSKRLLSDEIIRTIAVVDFNLNINAESAQDLCESMVYLSKQHLLEEQQKGEIGEVAPALIYQPGSILTRPTEGPFAEPLQTTENLAQYFRDIYDICQNPHSYTFDDIKNLAHNLGIKNLIKENMRVEDICDIIRRYVSRLQDIKRIQYAAE